ncbi:MAG: aminopeptidase P N-terminal domain-containing protein [Glaciimonas sp.]|nr:aminopeptidase P N-terminal domain-containing protein [Glaciimonas sp.]
MFESTQYSERHHRLRQQFSSGLLLILGNSHASINYPHNHYWFRQDSSFTYFFGLNEADIADVIDIDGGDDILFGDDPDIQEVVWAGQQSLLLVEREKTVNVSTVKPISAMSKIVVAARSKQRMIHYLPAYRGESILVLSRLFEATPEQVEAGISPDLIAAKYQLA